MALLIIVTKIAPGAGTLWPWDSCCGVRWWAEEVKMVSSKPSPPHRSMLTRYAAACGQWLMFWYLQVNHRSAAAKTFQNCLTPRDRFHQRHNYEQIFHPALSDVGYHDHCQFGQKCIVPCLSKAHRTAGESIGQPLISIMWIWCRRGSPEQKKCFALSLSSICVSSLDVWRLWITWFYRLINGGDFRQRLLEHETQSRARKSPDVDIDQSVRYSQHIDRSAWSGIFTWRFWPNLLRGHYVCSIEWFSNIVAMDKLTS